MPPIPITDVITPSLPYSQFSYPSATIPIMNGPHPQTQMPIPQVNIVTSPWLAAVSIQNICITNQHPVVNMTPYH